MRMLGRAGLLSVCILVVGCNQEQQGAQPPAGAIRPQVSVITLHPRAVAITAELPGRVGASLTADVVPQVTGIIKTRLFKEGTEVKAGDALYQIDPASYQASYDSAEATLQKDQAAIPSAQAKVDRYQNLIKQNAVSSQDLDDARATLAQAKADVAAAKSALETARINLDYTTMKAPIGGRVDASTITEGALVSSGQSTALTTIRQLDPINVDVTESSANLLNFLEAVKSGRIKTTGPGVSVRLKLENGATYAHAGTLRFVEANVSTTTGTFTVRAEFPNPDRLLLPGMYARAILEVGLAQNSFLVPQRAVSHNTKGEATASFVGGDGKVVQRVLSVQRNVGNNWLVDAGVSDGDRVIVEGIQLVRAGQEVTATEVSVDDATGDIRPLSQSSALDRPSDASAPVRAE
ncbi:efflux RND transporter periplasmic adaptor subunit [Labrys sp. ZIDIC5]|uniref:efflux RND transporter periplasmic adaptor subunit n=1 Tax=Labrys sedimenti TaxID=3106036 RepID=UPI002ACAC1A2|nr:efflux RND transporter periplasmic adaptor subunit [Labrys sp. ZIDIC5]MDZ5451259.1 efflux RND transporter periplasmic adaptor subunit [Labrys sp. ZIDIC5]